MLTRWFRKVLSKDSSKEVAKTRLCFALICDKLDVSKEILNNLQREIVEVISRYFEIDKKDVKLNIRKNEDLSLVFKTPIRAAKRRDMNNSKSEARNPKQFQMTEIQMTKTPGTYDR